MILYHASDLPVEWFRIAAYHFAESGTALLGILQASREIAVIYGGGSVGHFLSIIQLNGVKLANLF